MRELAILPLTQEAFAPFGTLVEYSAEENRCNLIKELQNLRSEARPHLDFVTARSQHLPLVATVMERHRYSSQSFVPIDVARYLVLVAPHAPAGGPNMAEARLFAASGRQSITYRAGVWHHPLTPLDRSGVFAILTFRAGDSSDDEFVTLPEPVRLGAGSS
jgi:ureidoglycolate lyase